MPGYALTVAAGARVEARILARDVTVLGTVSGRITATEIIDIRAGARVSGELAAPSVALAEGAEIRGPDRDEERRRGGACRPLPDGARRVVVSPAIAAPHRRAQCPLCRLPFSYGVDEHHHWPEPLGDRRR